MRLICPNCDTQYEVDASMIPPSGRDVQCSNCGWTWFQAAEQAAAPVQAEPQASTNAERSGSGLDEAAASFFERRPVEAGLDDTAELAEVEAHDAVTLETGSANLTSREAIRRISENAAVIEAREAPPPDLEDQSAELETPTDTFEDTGEAKDEADPRPVAGQRLEPYGASATIDVTAKVDQPVDAVVLGPEGEAAPASEEDPSDAEVTDAESDEAHQAEVESVPESDAQEMASSEFNEESDRSDPSDATELEEDSVEDDLAGARTEAEVEDAKTEETLANGSPVGARPRPVDTHVLGILRAEAEREIAQRRAEESGSLETQPDLGLADPASRPPIELSDRLARLRGEDIDGFTDTPSREELPDVEDINASLTATSDRAMDQVRPAEAVDVLRRRAGFRLGFVGVMLAVVALILLYLNAPQIANAVPLFEPALAAYVDWANGFRLGLEGFLSQTVDRITGGAQASG